MEGHDVHGVGVPALAGGLGRHPEPDGQVRHAVEDHALGEGGEEKVEEVEQKGMEEEVKKKVKELKKELEEKRMEEEVDEHLVLGRVLCDPAEPGLGDVVAVQELLLRGGLQPDLGEGVKRRRRGRGSQVRRRRGGEGTLCWA